MVKSKCDYKNRWELIGEMMSEREENLNIIRELKYHNTELEYNIVRELADSNNYDLLQVNWPIVKYRINNDLI